MENITELERFQRHLTGHSSLEIVQRYITGGPCAMVNDECRAEAFQKIAKQFTVHHTTIHIVGSAKLGFSIAPHKRYHPFGQHSDIDIAIVSTELYLRVWREVSFLLNADPMYNWKKKQLLLDKHLTGWLRPDALPSSPALPFADDWFTFFRELTASRVLGPYMVNAGIYYDVDFLENYQSKAVQLCQERKVSR